MFFTVKTNKDNLNYMNIKRSDLMALLVVANMPDDIKKIVDDINYFILDFEKDIKQGYISTITIKKDSELANYLLNTQNVTIINKDKIISYKKVVNAFNIAIYSDNKIYKNIYPLFKDRVSGNYDDLVTKYDKKVLEYILENNDLEKYILNHDDKYKKDEFVKQYVVYEDGKFSLKPLIEKSEKIKVKNK